jgi:CRISPR/Cas system-associated exonuclease Cas4 (RecB family)
VEALVTEVDVNRWILKAMSRERPLQQDPSVIYVSEIASPCLRKSYYQRTRLQQPSPAEYIKSLGNDIHLKIQDVLREEEYQVEAKMSIDMVGYRIVGRVDAVKLGDREHVLEFKVVDELPEDPYPSHELQLQAYLIMYKIEVGYLIYISRRDGRVRVFTVYRNKKKVQEFYERAREYHYYLENNKTPPPEHGPWCNNCNFKLTCYGR